MGNTYSGPKRDCSGPLRVYRSGGTAEPAPVGTAEPSPATAEPAPAGTAEPSPATAEPAPAGAEPSLAEALRAVVAARVPGEARPGLLLGVLHNSPPQPQDHPDAPENTADAAR
ncbi:MAG: hypothetical protein QG608_3796 [Actinomycetota bacterium]|nr:hypothetical protein [Actinomycetota bacterium]